MGIPSYFNYIIQNYEILFKKLSEFKEIHNLFLDCNSIIYDSLRKMDYSKYSSKTKFEMELIKNVCSEIDRLVDELSVTQLVFIAFDGVAPVAKMKQQQIRRHKSHLLKNLEDQVRNSFENEQVNGKNTQNSKTWDTSAITPGTNFMNVLTKNIVSYYKQKSGKLHYIVTGTDKHGEGEHKIFEYIRQQEQSLKYLNNFVYGLDADLIMLSLQHLYVSKNIFLCRELPPFKSPLQEIYAENEMCIMDIHQYSDIVYHSMIDFEKLQKSDMTNKQRNEHKIYKINDYIFISFILGNDFMPHFPALNIRTNGIQILMDTYKKTIGIKEYLCNKEGVIWKNVLKLFKDLSENEYSYLMNEYKINEKMSLKPMKINEEEDKMRYIQSLPIYNRTKETIINPSQPYWQHRYYEQLFNININSRATGNKYIKFICLNYLEGLEWTYLYYIKGCKNYQWCYKYSYPPLLCDLVRYIPQFNTTMIEENYHIVSPYTQLAYVLPGQSLHLLPKKVQDYMMTKYKDVYFKEHELEWAFCRYLWEAHLDIPEMDIIEMDNDIQEIILKQ